MGIFTKEFFYTGSHTTNAIKILLDLPLAVDVEELVYTLIQNNDLPVFKDKGGYLTV